MSKIPRLKPVVSVNDIAVTRKVPEMVRVPAIDPIVGPVICEAIFSLPTHWAGGRTVICTGKEECEHCAHIGTKHYFLLAVWDRNESAAKWVQLTEHAAASLLNQIAELQIPLYGCVVRISRERKTLKAPITVVIDRYASVPGRLPKAIDPQETIERVFGSRDSSRSQKRKVV
jgi:hypothetical protein